MLCVRIEVVLAGALSLGAEVGCWLQLSESLAGAASCVPDVALKWLANCADSCKLGAPDPLQRAAGASSQLAAGFPRAGGPGDHGGSCHIFVWGHLCHVALAPESVWEKSAHDTRGTQELVRSVPDPSLLWWVSVAARCVSHAAVFCSGGERGGHGEQLPPTPTPDEAEGPFFLPDP